jgi:hypothetical protein
MSPIYSCGPALGGDGLQLFLIHPQGQEPKARLLDFPPMGAGVQPIITDGDLALVRDVGDDPGSEGRIRARKRQPALSLNPENGNGGRQ